MGGGQYVQQTTSPDSVFAVYPAANGQDEVTIGQHFSYPNHFYLLTGRKVLYQAAQYSRKVLDRDDIAREMLTNWIFRGEFGLLWKCPTKIELPGDLFRLTTTALELRREQLCRNLRREDLPTSVPEALKSYKLDYILVDKTIPGLEHWASRNKNHQHVWSSSSGKLMVYQFSDNIGHPIF